jgi:sugar phosphate isomerase/epimerase
MVDLSLAPGVEFEVRTLEDLDTYLGAVADAGFPCVSLGLWQLAGDPEGAAWRLARRGLRCPDLLSLQISRHERDVLAQAERLAPAAQALGADYVLASFWTRVNEESIDRFGRCADLMARAGARLALEMPPVGELDNVGASLRVVRAVGLERAALLLDTFHFCRGASSWAELDSVPLTALGYVQFTDALPAASDDVMTETMDRRVMPGDGELPLSRFATTLTRRGWSGLVSVEVLSADLRGLDVAAFARRAYETSVPYWSV